MELIARIMDVYAQIDKQVAAYQLLTGLRCPNGCGICCIDAEVYTSRMEMLPAAHELLLRGEAQPWLERIQSDGLAGLCVFYRKHDIENTGHCDLYAFRPSVCRLFGFSSVRNRTGQRILSTCKRLKTESPHDVAKASEHQDEAPGLSQYSSLLMGFDPSANRLMPINDALRQAILMLGLQMQMNHDEKLGTHSAA